MIIMIIRPMLLIFCVWNSRLLLLIMSISFGAVTLVEVELPFYVHVCLWYSNSDPAAEDFWSIYTHIVII